MLSFDALMGGTLSLLFITSTTPMVLHNAKKMADVRRDVVAEQISMLCSQSRVSGEDTDLSDTRFTEGDKLTVTGDCGVSGNTMTITFKSGATESISLHTDDLYIVDVPLEET